MTKRSIIKLAVGAMLASVFITGCQKSQKTLPTQKADAQTSTFVNFPDGLTGALKENYVDFQFDYPKSWVMDPASSQDGASNFVRVERRIADKGGKFTQENFAVGYFHGTGTASGDKALMPKVAKQLEDQFVQGFTNYKFISDSPAKLGKYNGYEFRFESIIRDTLHGTVTLWGRTLLLPNPEKGKKNGVTIVMMGSTLVADIKSASDIGVKGQLPIILKNFKMGKDVSKTDKQ